MGKEEKGRGREGKMGSGSELREDRSSRGDRRKRADTGTGRWRKRMDRDEDGGIQQERSAAKKGERSGAKEVG